MSMKSIWVGLLIGLLVFFIGWINKATFFNKSQKVIITILSIVFFPGGILVSIVLFLFNQRSQKIKIKDNIEYKLKLLEESYNDSIITLDEYQLKKNNLLKDNNQNQKLKELYNSGLLTKEEFDSKMGFVNEQNELKTNDSKQLRKSLFFIGSIVILILTISSLAYLFIGYKDINSSVHEDIVILPNDQQEIQKGTNIELDKIHQNEVEQQIIEIPSCFIFYSASINDFNKPIHQSPEFSLYEQKTVCTRIFEIKDSQFLLFDERMKDYLSSIFSINECKVHKYNDYEDAYNLKNKITEGVIETSLFDRKYSDYSTQ